MSSFRTIPITVTAAADGLSNAIDLEDQNLAGFIIPAVWTSSAPLSFLTAPSLTGTYGSVFDDANTEVSTSNIAAGRTVLFGDVLQKKLRGVRFLKLRSGLAASPIQQAAPRALAIIAATLFP